jgi:hypothetical protein
MLSMMALSKKAGECRDIPDSKLCLLGNSIKDHYRVLGGYPPQLIAEAYIDFKAKAGKPIDSQGFLNVIAVQSVEPEFLINYLKLGCD